MIELIANGPTVMAIQDITRRAEKLGIDNSQQDDLNYNSNESEIS
jgi:hypothetical protein